MDSKLYAKGTLISQAEHLGAQDASFSEARMAGNKITIACYGAQGREQVVFDLERREVVKGEVRISMASITRFDIDHYVIDGDMKESTVFVLIISDGSHEIKLRDRVKNYYGITDREMEKANARVIMNLHALPAICDVPYCQTYPFIPADITGAFGRGQRPEITGRAEADQKSAPPPGPYDTIIGGCAFLVIIAAAAAAVWLLIRRLLPFFG